jgi:iron complex outermembrane receptor protein
LQWRPLGLGGNPLSGEGKQDSCFFDSYRVGAVFDGEVQSVNWNVALTYSEGRRDADTPDILVNRLDRALRGFGGANCTGTVAGDAAAGCSYFNPFSTGIAMNPASGLVNPALGSGGTFVAGTENNLDVVRSLFGSYSFNDETTLAVFDAVLAGETGLSLPGSLPSQTTLTAAVINFTDRDPPFARVELNYDPFTANPIGRSFKLALNKRF